jgi:flagellar protein FliS
MKKKQVSKKGLNMYAGNAYSTYTENNINIESPTKLIEMLYEGVLKFNAQAKKAIKDKNIEKRVYWTNRSIAIITELMACLDMDQKGTVSQYLKGLYEYQIKLLTEAGLHNDMAKLDECTNVFKELLAAWRETTNVA